MMCSTPLSQLCPSCVPGVCSELLPGQSRPQQCPVMFSCSPLGGCEGWRVVPTITDQVAGIHERVLKFTQAIPESVCVKAG